MSECTDCGCWIHIPLEAMVEEIITCPDCGMDYVVINEEGLFTLVELALIGEDWGQ